MAGKYSEYLYIAYMNLVKQVIIILSLFALSMGASQAKTEKECFEKTSRAIFKFNQGLDRANHVHRLSGGQDG